MLYETVDQTAPDLELFFSDASSTPALNAPARPRLGADFTRLWAATASSNLSDGIRQAALPLLVASLTRNPALVAGVAFASQLPWLLFGLASGVLIDRVERRRVIGMAHLFRMTVVILLAVAVAGGVATVPLVYLAAFLLGTAETLFDNAAQVIVPELVDESQLEVANGRQTMALIAGQQLLGPVLGASLFSAALFAPLLVDGLALLVATVCVLSIRVRPAPAPRSTRPCVPMSPRGWRWLWASQSLRMISLAEGVVNVALLAHMAIFVLFTLEVLGVGGIGYALILAAYAVGGIAGGWIAPRLAARITPQWAIVSALVAAAASILVTGLTSSPWVAAAMQATLAVAGSVWAVVTCSLRQRLAPAGMLGRITGMHRVVSWGGATLGAVGGGAVAATLGLRAPFLLGAAALAVVAMAFATTRIDWHGSPARSAH